jgi:16S rRNA (guanine966-N2)-methyltransferase
VRVVAGEWRGHRLSAPAGAATRPTADRVREALFSILGPLEGLSVLDLFAGSGALGLEAISRGAASAVFVERGAPALDLIRRNIEELDVGDRTRIVRADAMRFALELGSGAYDIALADPPYAEDFAERLVQSFRRSPFATILAVEHNVKTRLDGDDTRRYGDTAITFCYAP